MKKLKFITWFLFYLFLNIFACHGFAQQDSAKQKSWDANQPLLPANSAWAIDRFHQKLDSQKVNNYNLVFIGNSITQTLGDIGGKYDSLKLIWQRHFAPRKAINLGFNGFRTEGILWLLQNGLLSFRKPPKLFVLLIGTNNADSRNFPFVHSAEQIFSGTKAIVDFIRKKYPASNVLVLRIFPKGSDDQRSEATSPPIFSFSSSDVEIAKRAGELTSKLADGKHVFWLDLSRVFLRSDNKINTALMPDLLHPNYAGAKAWVNAMEPTLARLMGDKPILDTDIVIVDKKLTTGWMRYENLRTSSPANNFLKTLNGKIGMLLCKYEGNLPVERNCFKGNKIKIGHCEFSCETPAF
ncbi:MAG: lipolytic protein family [Chitinophagaceae bacterium]|nr:lipolytic protein family [Chitinophagaceae bacterium]